jgi:hypothetical protein
MDNFRETAILNVKGKYYQHFGIRPMLCSVYGDKPEDIVTIEFKISTDQSIPLSNDKSMSADYWGWYDYEKKKFTMIYAKHFLLEMCFAYGIQACEDKGQGKAYRLEIVEIIKSKYDEKSGNI